MRKTFISCDQATTICDKNQYGEATFIEKVKLSLHFIFCKYCRMYSKQNTLLSKIFGCYAKMKCKEKHYLHPKEKQKMEENIKEKR